MAATVLITGANGFIGSHTTFLMETLGQKVIPLDIATRSRDLSLLPIKTPSRIMDVADATTFRELCSQEKPTHIFHAAHPPRDETPAVLDFCYHAMTNILEAAKELKVHRVVYASSGALYGQLRRKDHTSIREDDPVAIYPTYFYRSAKILSEWLGDFYKEHYRVDFVALRFSSVYGPGLGRGIPLELKKGIFGQNCRPYLTRLPDDLIYVDDVTDAVRMALFSNKPLSRAYNIALDKAYGEEDLKSAIENALPELSFSIGNHPQAAVTGTHRDRDVLDITLARRELGFNPKVDLNQGVARIVAWVKGHADQLR